MHVDALPGKTGVGKPHLFVTLDGLRGVAALAVIFFHFPQLLGRAVFAHGYLAVDFFFMLSGFVLTSAYQRRLDEGWPTAAFMKTRIARLYPLYFAGLLLGFGLTQLHGIFGSTALGGSRWDLLLGLLILPKLVNGHAFYPLDFPAWSIFFELLVNLVHALFLRRRSPLWIAGFTLLGGVGIVFYSVRLSEFNVGVDAVRGLWSVFRVLFSYTAGMLLYRLWKSGRVSRRVHPAVIGLLLLAVLCAPVAGRASIAYDLAMTMLIFPVLLLAGAGALPPVGLVRSLRVMGAASYAVYLLHAPLYVLFSRGWLHLFRRPMELAAPWTGAIFLMLLTGICLVLDRVYDAPARDALRRWLVGQTTIRQPGH